MSTISFWNCNISIFIKQNLAKPPFSVEFSLWALLRMKNIFENSRQRPLDSWPNPDMYFTGRVNLPNQYNEVFGLFKTGLFLKEGKYLNTYLRTGFEEFLMTIMCFSQLPTNAVEQICVTLINHIHVFEKLLHQSDLSSLATNYSQSFSVPIISQRHFALKVLMGVHVLCSYFNYNLNTV